MKLQELPKLKKRGKKRIGRGYGSGKGGHTVGYGQKGQKSRSGGKIKPSFEGGQLPFIKRIPHKRGFKRLKERGTVINLRQLKRFKKDTVVDREALVKVGLLDRKKTKIKILGHGNINKALTVQGIPTSASAQKKIIKAGGKISE